MRTIASRYSRSRQLDSLLPYLTPEYLPDLAGFSRRWFRQFFSLMPGKFVLVLDNYQELPHGAPLHTLLRDAANELPDDLNLVVISRLDPPEEFARLTANRKLASLDWTNLQLTLDETAKLASQEIALDEAKIKALHNETQGWAAGVTLMLERVRRTGKVNRIDRGDSMETVFNYFSDLIFKQTLPEDQRSLVQLSLLSASTSAQAVELTGRPNAGRLLESLARQRMFVDRRAGQEHTFAPPRKAQHKVLALLKTLISLGAKGVSTAKLPEVLWPGLDGDAAQNNLKANLHRLRKLLGSDDSVLVLDAKVTLNESEFWCDALAFETLADRILAADAKSEYAESQTGLLKTYRGDYIPEESEIGCVVATRERLRSKFRRSVLKVGRLLETRHNGEEAIELYQRGIDSDNLCEELYQRLIICLKQHGQKAEALNAYRRCRDMLSIVLGVAPSKETQALVAAAG